MSYKYEKHVWFNFVWKVLSNLIISNKFGKLWYNFGTFDPAFHKNLIQSREDFSIIYPSLIQSEKVWSK